MKILYVTNSLSSHGGLERILINKANYLSRTDGFEVSFLLPSKQSEVMYKLDEKVKIKSIDPLILPRLKWYNFLPLIFKYYLTVNKIISKINPDVVIVANNMIEYYFIPFIHPSSKKIREFHSSFFYENYILKSDNSIIRKIKNALNKYMLSKYDAAVVLTNDEAKYITNCETVVIPNFILPTNLTTNLNVKKVCALGRITPVKGYDMLLKVWKVVEDKFPDWKLEIYGQEWDGTKENLLKIQKKLQIKNVFFCGETNDSYKTLSQCSIFLSTSISESFSLVILEAQAVGLSVISFDSPYGPRNIINDKINGFIVPFGNIDEMANVVIANMENQIMRENISKNARNNAKNFYPNVIMPIWQDFFLKLITDKL